MKNGNKKTSKKKSLFKSDEKLVKSTKKLTNIKSEYQQFNDMDSLVVLSNARERKKLSGIDERIKFLKAELKSLLCDKNSETSGRFINNDVPSSNISPNTAAKASEVGIEHTEENKNLNESQTNVTKGFNENFNSTPSEFPEWLNKTTENTDRKCENEKLDSNKLLSYSEQIDVLYKRSPPDSLCLDSKFSYLSWQNIERLLYESFLMQKEHIYNSEVGTSELVRCTKKTKQKDGKSKRQCTKFKRLKPLQNSFSPKGCLFRRGMKRRLLNTSVSQSDIEIINLDTSLDCNKELITDLGCMDFDVSNCDWNEPFETSDKVEFHSDMQIVQDNRKKNYINYEDLSLNCPGEPEIDSNVSYSNVEKIQPKKIWECPICFERAKGQEVVATQCGHVFCRKCLENHISKIKNNCPSCRCDLQDKPFITLYNF